MSRVVWKENKVISIETRKGIFVLAQLSRSPYIIFYNCFHTSNQFNDKIDLNLTPILYCKAVTRNFLIRSNITTQKGIKPKPIKTLGVHWINRFSGSRTVTLWKGTENEKKFITIGDGGALVLKDAFNHKSGPYAHPSGVYDKIVIPKIRYDDMLTIGEHETTSLHTFPEANERLYLCYKFGENISPEKYILFDIPMPLEYKSYIDCITAYDEDEKKRLLSLYL